MQDVIRRRRVVYITQLSRYRRRYWWRSCICWPCRCESNV